MLNSFSVLQSKNSLSLGLMLLTLLGSSVASCSAQHTEFSAAPNSADQLVVESEPELANRIPGQPQALSDQKSESSSANAPRQAPQLIKTANLTIRVDDLEKSLEAVDQILSQKQGDLLNLNETRLPSSSRQTSTLTLRVPQQALTPTLTQLEELGKIQHRSITAKDVANQIVDNQARLRNLRKSEETVLKIMDRSGDIPDVLAASKELSAIRESIERIDAQVQSLQKQVAFSTINLKLETLSPVKSSDNGLGKQLGRAWKDSTDAMGELTLSFVKLAIWGLAFSPYLGGLCLMVWLGKRAMQKRSKAKTPISQD